MKQLKDQHAFAYSNLYKGRNRGKSSPDLRLFVYPQDPVFCVVKCLDEYFMRFEKRQGQNETQHFLSYNSPHSAVSFQVGLRTDEPE